MRACVFVADAVKCLLGPRSLQKLITTQKGEIILTNDGATALNSMVSISFNIDLNTTQIQKNQKIENGAARLLVQLSNSVDQKVGDGTTSVVILAAAMYNLRLIISFTI